MSTGPTNLVVKRRRREGKTDYNLRLRLLASRKPRLVVRRSLKNMTAQIVDYSESGDKVIATSNSRELIKLGWKHARRNIPAAYLTGLLIGQKAKSKGVKEAVLDLGPYKSIAGNVLYATLKGALDAGLNVPHDPKMLPESRLHGEHTKNPAQAKKDMEEVKKKIEAKK